MPFTFKRKPQAGDIEPAKRLSEALPKLVRSYAVERYISDREFRCQICNGLLSPHTQVHRRDWHVDAEPRNYIHADARKCLQTLRRTMEAHARGKDAHETL